MNIPIIKATIDTSGIEKAIEKANELIDKLNEIQSLSNQLADMVASIDFSVKMTEQPEDS